MPKGEEWVSATASFAAKDASGRRTGFRWVVVTLIFLVYMIASADRANIGFALPFIRKEFTMTNAQAGALVSLFFWGYALVQLPSGFALKRTGVRILMPAAMLLTSALTGFVGAAQSAFGIMSCRFLLGIAEGPMPVGMTTTINNWFPRREKGIASGIFLSSVKFGPVIVPPLCALIVSVWGWREIFFAFAIPGVALAIAWYVLITNSPAESRFCSTAEREYIERDARPVAMARTKENQNSPKRFALLDKLIRARKVKKIDDTADVFRSWSIWGCAAGYSFQLGISNVLLAWMPTYLLEVKHFSVMGTGLVSSAPWVGAVVGNLLGGWLSDRLLAGRRKPGMLFSAVATGAMMLTLLNAPAAPTLYAALMFLTGVTLSFGFSAYMAYPMSVASKSAFPIASALVNTGGQIGGACAPLAVGLLLDRLGWSSVFIFMALGSLMSFLIVTFIPEPLSEEVAR
jgi:MFS transporter, ACS family, glucarate transporter